MATIHDVAREAAVAPSTVSLVANGKPYVSKATRRRVREVMLRLGYRPRRARGLRAAGTADRRPQITLLYTHYSTKRGAPTAVCREWIHGARAALAEQRVDVSVFTAVGRYDDDVMFQQSLEAGEIDGMILMTPQPGEGYLDAAMAANVPLVVVNRMSESLAYSSVVADYRDLGGRAARHLLRRGHRRVGILCRRSCHWTSRDYHATFTETLASRGITPVLDVDLPVTLDHDPVATVDRILDRGVSAVFLDDLNAVAVADELERRGVRVPDDVSVLGMDNLGLMTQSGRTLTSATFGRRRMGRIAARLMLRMLQPARRFRSVCVSVPAGIRLGQTTAMARRPDVSNRRKAS